MLKYRIEKYLINQTFKKISPIFLWDFLYRIFIWCYYDIPQFCKRAVCHFKGGDERRGDNWNMPPEAYCYFCKRCNATESNYEPNTEYEIIRKGERFWERNIK